MLIFRPAIWRLLMMHWVIVNYELRQTSGQTLTPFQVVAHLYSAFVVDHAREIQERFWDIVLESQKQALGGFLSHENLERLVSTPAAELPKLLAVSAGASSKQRDYDLASYKKKAIRKSLGRTIDFVQRLTRRPRKIRTRVGRAPSTAHAGQEKVIRIVGLGNEYARQSYDRVQPSPPQETGSVETTGTTTDDTDKSK